MSRRLALAAILVALAVPSAAVAYSVSVGYQNVIRWDHSDLTYYLDPNDAPGVTDGSTVPTLKASFQGWQDVGCTGVTFAYLGATTNKSVMPISQKTNDKNELVWITNSAWTFGEQVLGVTSPLAYGDGTIVESDIAFNGYHYKWNTKGQIGWYSAEMDVKSVAIHEIGHFFGLQHVLYGYSPSDPPTMAPAVDPYGQSASLNADDQMGVCFLYPKDGYYTCTNDSQCPNILEATYNGEKYTGKLTCKSGYCSGITGISPGSVEFGGVCAKTTDCKSPTSCQTLDTGIQMCTQGCTTSPDNCSLGFHCATLYSASGNWCVPGNKKLVEGDKCSMSTDCSTSFCFPTPDGSGTYCRIACNKNNPTCPDGKVCWAPAGGTTGGCFPPDEVPEQKKPLDAECATDQQCKSNVCGGVGGTPMHCLKGCDPAAPDCYSGYSCQDIGGRWACVAGANKADGEPCSSDADCQSGSCVLQFGGYESFCRTACSLADWKCPAGTACVSYGDTQGGWCMPSTGKLETGAVCVGTSDCITQLCYLDGTAGQRYCTQSCLDGWCPGDLVCRDTQGDYGQVCALPEGAQAEVVELPPPAEEPVAADDVPPQGDDPGSTVTPTASSGWGCTAGLPGGSAAFAPLLAAVAFALRRRRG